jgi:predicted ATPase/DNA-binding CsgD family transcriptional regulator
MITEAQWESIQPKLELCRALHWDVPHRVQAPGVLPGQLTRFIGRGSTIELVGSRLAEHRLVSLVGPGGCGKTRLAIEVGRRTTLVPPGSVFFVDLSGLSDPRLVPGTVLRALGLREARGKGPLESLIAQLLKRDLLVLLDNCEHLGDACAALVEALARECPGLRMLATSREHLGVTGEAVVDVGGLELLERAGYRDEEWLLRSEAGKLFVDRARMARADFVAHGDDAVVVAGICERLDGIPLALEMAAARVRLMSVQAIAEGLSDRFSVLTANERARPRRQRSLLASIEWSCGLLGESERCLLYRLSVFASGFTFAAAKAVCAGDEVERDDVIGLLSSLVDKSVVQASPGVDRFRLHETMRAYAATALEAEGGTAAVRDRHLDYFTELANSLEPKTLTSEFALAQDKLKPELDNLSAALRWSLESKQFGTGAALVSSLGSFFYELGLNSEAVAQCEYFLAAEIDPSFRGSLLYLASRCSRLSDPPMSLRLASELVSLGRSLGDEAVQAGGLIAVAAVQVEADPAAALGAATEGIRLAQTSREPRTEVRGLWVKGLALCSLGRPAEALAVGEEALRASRACDWPNGEHLARIVISWSAMWTGRFGRALEETSYILHSSRTMPLHVAVADAHRAEVLACKGQDATALIDRAVSAVSVSGDSFFVANFNLARGRILIGQGQEDDGYQVLEAAIAKLESFGLFAMCVQSRALLAEVAVRRGELLTARLHLDGSSWRLPRAIEPAGAPVFRAEARLARAECLPARAHGLACNGLAAAFEGGHVLWVVELLELVGITSSDLGCPTEACRLLGAAESQRGLIGYVHPAPARDELAPVLVDLRTALAHDAFERAASEGRALSLEEAVAYACRGRGSHARGRSGWESLTPSEQRVVSLVGQHLTNAQIAARLFISVPTVKSHLNSVFAKLGTKNRGQLAAAAHRIEAS